MFCSYCNGRHSHFQAPSYSFVALYPRSASRRCWMTRKTLSTTYSTFSYRDLTYSMALSVSLSLPLFHISSYPECFFPQPLVRKIYRSRIMLQDGRHSSSVPGLEVCLFVGQWDGRSIMWRINLFASRRELRSWQILVRFSAPLETRSPVES
jgi:hypothetical protein